MAGKEEYAGIVSLLAPHKTDSERNTTLMNAATNSHAKTIKVIVGHDYGFGDSHGRTALMIAAQEGNLETLRALIEYEKGLKDNNGCTALVHAARVGHRDVAKLLIIHEKDAAGWTMPMYTAALEDTDMVSQRLDEKDQRDKQGQTALIITAQNGRGETVKLLMKHENGVSGWTGLIYCVS